MLRFHSPIYSLALQFIICALTNQLTTPCLCVCTGLEEINRQQFIATAGWKSIKVTNERQLRAALKNPMLGWADRRVVQLAEDVLMSATLAISSPVTIEGFC